jgi:dipeptidyl aminopeptidase/acylaminoacyl peptidase
MARMKIFSAASVAASALYCMGAMSLVTARAGAADLTLETIMADPDWMGAAVSQPYWSADGKSVYYSSKRKGSMILDQHRLSLAESKDLLLGPKDAATADAPAIYDRAGKRAAFVRNGDVFVREISSGRLQQLTRSAELKSDPQFSADGKRLSFRIGTDWYIHDFDTALTMPVAVVKAQADPDAAPKSDDLRDMQLRTFSTLQRLREDSEAEKKHAEELRRADATRAGMPFYLGDEVVIRATALSSDGDYLLVVTSPKAAVRGREGQLTRYVTESGYEEFEAERLRVGRNPPAPQALVLLNLKDHSQHPLALDNLPGINEDPLKAIREENAKLLAASSAIPSDDKPKQRAITVTSDEPDPGAGGIQWSNTGHALAIQLLSVDNKDRWLVSVDFSSYSLIPQHRLSDTAWINESYNEFGWLNDDHTLWFLSEESGFSHLYVKDVGGPPRALTHGKFEVSNPLLSTDGRWFYILANAAAPYSYDVYRVSSGGGELQRVSRLQGAERFSLSPSGKQLLIEHSSSYIRSQLALQSADGSKSARELLDTRTEDYKAMHWIEPEIVQIPSTHFKGAIFAKVYRAAGGEAQRPEGQRPAVIFVHGAGYLQDVTLRFSYYFREQMFNNLLAQRGYTVVSLDYRASQGYGRDWRTAIYRQMGYPELEDMLDVKRWMVEQRGVDAKKVGVYGGSYGGFMTLMALFRAPGEFAAGAALRPVTDWMQYDHGYTSAILNDPQIDPLAYQRSSPIEYAAALRDPLLICHGVIDDNVLFEDSMRLYQRLIELHKDNFEMSPYPLDRHAFSNADSWLDEYKRINKLFREHLE